MPAGRERCVSGMSLVFQEAEALTPHWGTVLLLFYSLAQTWELALALPACGPGRGCGEEVLKTSGYPGTQGNLARPFLVRLKVM